MKKTALISTGTDISDNDLKNIQELATQVLDLAAYRVQLNEYLQNRMHAVAPNLSVIVGEQVGARLIAHAGSLMNLAKFPASTVQILGAEKALFRALKTRHETPKYGLIYHASLVGQAAQKHKGKISRVLAVGAGDPRGCAERQAGQHAGRGRAREGGGATAAAGGRGLQGGDGQQHVGEGETCDVVRDRSRCLRRRWRRRCSSTR